ncbi:MAG: bacillithiol biosynthesis deacetylase BshB1 [Bdellovibrionales bacterium]|nr:bacillithiol biosynthesis deacetylase BshB1 [Bdellovibrionales bacterium]
MTRQTLLDVLAIGPHPDDVEICCGGLLAKSSAQGYQIGVVDLARGELSTQGTLEQRAIETQRASAILGIGHRENLGLPDGEIGVGPTALGNSPSSQLGVTIAALRRLRPKLLLLPYWEARHPDHVAASELLTRAVFHAGLAKFLPELGEPYVPLQVLYYQMRVTFQPSFITDISDVVERKMEAVRAYGSQLRRSTSDGATGTLLSSDLSLQSMVARAQFYGAMIGVSAAEPFLMRNAVSIDDPIAHFSTLGARAVHIF